MNNSNFQPWSQEGRIGTLLSQFWPLTKTIILELSRIVLELCCRVSKMLSGKVFSHKVAHFLLKQSGNRGVFSILNLETRKLMCTELSHLPKRLRHEWKSGVTWAVCYAAFLSILYISLNFSKIVYFFLKVIGRRTQPKPFTVYSAPGGHVALGSLSGWGMYFPSHYVF